MLFPNFKTLQSVGVKKLTLLNGLRNVYKIYNVFYILRVEYDFVQAILNLIQASSLKL